MPRTVAAKQPSPLSSVRPAPTIRSLWSSDSGLAPLILPMWSSASPEDQSCFRTGPRQPHCRIWRSLHILFAPLTLPEFDPAGSNVVLARTLTEVQAEAAARVRAHLRSLGRGGEAWVGDGMGRIAGASSDHEQEVCPFCAQGLEGSPLIQHY